ncbi:stalk domain-containing protein [Paenibacillus apiarius]|uniref:Copper amine oxidase N-terminal domain-containing protein n=1 Tax=Paenibacillus apiarius TaxID=46240 RepID=A0ABT4E411_9BACL|nr:stalk domain-containing protein [Paenibacillus apiarius]MCY9515038.1 copper amine oxidase N-terminal domain-containing protein [Paenibacillus apiarius]MCY9522976.1 copper amine oxidase N-terminal domain-containing protein [Paenibacillus apiarius]MCY9553779.1 copper amine oxidase N-terminal domain-containing protein [Paenibacillus apiarius]MCY9556388.1 copper amine oxidase N-terminal domain-containing protein [Paenibacillus apiarius]MCY9684822.1 copper amine oxidase N-terminal domain-contain
MNKMKKAVIGLVTAMLLLMPLSAYAASPTKMDVDFNQTRVKVNGQLVGNNIFRYEGTAYASLKTMTEVFKLDLTYDEESGTYYLGMLPAGVVSDSAIDAWVDNDKATDKQAEETEKKGKRAIEAALNAADVEVHGIKIKGNSITYNGRTYVPFRSVAEILKMDIKHDGTTATTYIGYIPDFVKNPPKKENSKTAKEKKSQPKKTKLYDVAASGEMKGWRKLKGHQYEGAFEIYYMLDGSMMTTNVKDIRKVDLKKKVQWVDDKGRKRTNTVKEIYSIFSEFSNQYTSEWFTAKFGNLYADWLMGSTIRAENIVEEYLTATGKLKAPESFITLTPDAVVEFE